jgi:predicted extracellular nuclease
MKNSFSLLLAVLMSLGINAQTTIFSSNFENWAGGNPTDWMGTRTNIPTTEVNQVNTGAVYGSNLCRLSETTTSHKRFSTVAQTIVNGNLYQIKVWVRGQGQIRAGLHNGTDYQAYFNSSGASGAVYDDVNSATNVQLTFNFPAQASSAAAEFILSVRNTVAPNHIQIDSVAIIESIPLPPTQQSIYSIQFTAAADGNSPLINQTVITGGIVSAKVANPTNASGSFNGYFIQDNSGAWNGIAVIDATNTVDIGDSVIVAGTVKEVFGFTMVDNLTSFTKVSSNNTLHAIVNISTNDINQERYESVLVKNIDATISDANAGNGQFEINDNSGAALVGRIIYQHTGQALGEVYDFTGVVYYSFSEYKICPRSAADVVLKTNVNPNFISIYDIQFTTLSNGDSPLKDQFVNTGGIVTGTHSAGYFIQSGVGAWNGVYVFNSTHTRAVGDSVLITARVVEFNGMTQLTSATAFTNVSSGNTLPNPATISTTAANTEMYEGVLVKVTNANCTDANFNANFGMWTVNDGSGATKVHNLLHQYTTPVQGTKYDITGPVYFSFGENRIEPRSQADVTIATSVRNENAIDFSVFPNPSNDFINIQINNNENLKEVKLYDISGKMIYLQTIKDNNSIQKMDISTLSNGVYFVEIISEKAVATKKIIKQ